MKIPFGAIQRDDEEFRGELLDALRESFLSGRWIGGPEVEALERELGAFVGREAVSCASGTDALVLALRAAGVGPGDAVAVPAFSSGATAEAVALAGGVPRFADVDPDSFCMDAETLSRAALRGARAVVAVGLFGRAAPCAGLSAVLDSEAPGAALVEDAAQSFGAFRDGVPSCGASPYAATSFYPTKPFGGYGDGGMVFLPDAASAARVRALCNHGQYARDRHEEIGFNSRLDAMQAALLRVKFRRLGSLRERRAAAAARYDALLRPSAERVGIALPSAAAGESPVWAQYTVRVLPGRDGADRRDALRARLAELGAGTAVYYSAPLHSQPCWARFAAGAECPNAERLSREVLSLPLTASISAEEQERVAEALVASLETFR